jgi:hypothetical protein
LEHVATATTEEAIPASLARPRAILRPPPLGADRTASSRNEREEWLRYLAPDEDAVAMDQHVADHIKVVPRI